MALQIVADTPGLWRDPAWAPEMPGLYALVVGASRYPNFKGGGSSTTESFDMGQLVSSAGTAAKMFEWLRDDFRHRDLPFVWCQLLLSPTEEEKTELDHRGLTHYAVPTHENLSNAIDRWTGNVPSTGVAADRSRTFFFFSGHGVQTNWHPVLLPSDYLDTALGRPKLENCIGVADLLTWMDRNPVAEHLALIDACRNEFPPLAAKGSTANTSFPVNAAGGKAPRTAASLSSTSPNAVAFQVPGRPSTFFGQAVLEALASGIIGGNDARLAFRELVDYVKPRINALLQEAQPGTTLDQTARPRVEGDDTMIVTESGAPPAAHSPGALETLRSHTPRAAPPAPVRAPATAAVVQAMAGRFDSALSVPEPIALDALRRDFNEIHRRFGHEYASYPWRDGMALYALSDGQRIEADGSIVRDVQRNEPSSLVQLDLLLAPRSGGVLLVFEGAQFVQRERLAVALPTDVAGSVPIRLSLAFGPLDARDQPKLQGIQARLGPSDQNPHYQYLWTLTREADLGSLAQAAARADPDRLKLATQDKVNGQTAAVAGMLLLARAGRIGDVHDWTRNLMQWFPEIPDGAVLWAESLRSAIDHGHPAPFGVTAPIEEMASALLRLGQQGMPFFADSLEFAKRLVRYVLRQLKDGEVRSSLLVIQRRLEQLFQTAMPSGHFIALAGLPRPAWLDAGSGTLSVPELLALLGRKAVPAHIA